MPLDSSIILQGKPLDLMGSFERALSMRDLINRGKLQQAELQDQQALKDAYAKNTSIDPNGQATVNQAGVLADLAKSAPRQVLPTQQSFAKASAETQKMKLDSAKSRLEITGQLLGSAKDQPSYEAAIKQLNDLGVQTANHFPAQYDPNVVGQAVNQTLTAKDQLDQVWKQKNFDQKTNEIAAKREDTRENREARLQSKNQDRASKMASDLKKDLDADAGRTGNFGQVSRKVLQAQNLETLANAFPDGNLDSRQVEELSLGLANMLAGSGGTSRAQVEGLLPHTWTGKVANVQEWLTSNPQGAGQQEFVKRMMHTIQREKETSLNQLNQIREQRLTAHARLAKEDPETYKAILQSYGMNPDDYDQRGLRKTPKKSEAPSSKSEYHDMSDDELTKAYKAAGGT